MRRVVVWSGVLLTVAGVLVIFTLPVALSWRWVGAGLWGLVGLREARDIANGYKVYRRLRIDSSGAAALQDGGGDWVSVEIQAGSVVLQRLAWLRLRLPDGSRCAELLRCNTRENEEWRRFQLVWRHLGGAR